MVQNIKFEEALKKLENIVEKLEQGETPLDESIKLFEEGNDLVKVCMEKLNKAEDKIKSLTDDKQSK